MNREIKVTYRGSDKTHGAVRSVKKGVDSVGNSMSNLTRNAVNLQRTFAALTLGIAGNNIIRTTGDLQSNVARITALSKNLKGDLRFISDESKRLSIEINAATSSYSKFLVLQEAGVVTGEQTRQMFTGIGDAAARFGATAGQTENVIYGLAQALGQGQVQAQELNQVVEPLPGLLNIIARNAGQTAAGYRELVKSGKVTSEVFGKDIIKAFKELDGAAESLRNNIPQTLTRLSNEFKETVFQFESSISKAVSTFADIGIGALQGFVEHIEVFKNIGKAILLAYGVRAIGQIGNFVSAQSLAVRKSIAFNQALVVQSRLKDISAAADLRAARTEADRTASAVARTQAIKQSNKVSNKSAVISKVLRTRHERHAAAMVALTAAQDRFNASVARTTVVSAAASRAGLVLAASTRAVGAAMAFLGGPVGIAILATAALASYVYSMREGYRAADEMKRASDALNGSLSNNTKLTRENARTLIEENEKRKNELIDQIELIKTAIEGYGVLGFLFNRKLIDETKLASLQKQLQKVFDRLSNLKYDEKIATNAAKTADEMAAQDKSMARINANAERLKNIPFTPFIDKLIGDKRETAQKIKQLESELSNVGKVVVDESVRETVKKAIQAEIDQLSGEAKKREEAIRLIKEQEKAYEQLGETFKTERQKIDDLYENARETILIELVADRITPDEAREDFIKLREQIAQKNEAIDTQEAEAARAASEEIKRANAEKIADYQAYRDRLIAARSVADPTAGEVERYKAAVQDIKAEFAGRVDAEKEVGQLILAEALNHQKNMKAIYENSDPFKAKQALQALKGEADDTFLGLSQSFRSETEKVVDAYAAGIQTIKDNEKFDVSIGEERVKNDEKRKKQRENVANQLNTELRKIREREKADAQAAADALVALDDEQFDARIAMRTRLANAIAVSNPAKAERELYKIESAKLLREVTKGNEKGGITKVQHDTLIEALSIAHNKRLAVIYANSPEQIDLDKQNAAKDAAIANFKALTDSLRSEKRKIQDEFQSQKQLVLDVEVYDEVSEKSRAAAIDALLKETYAKLKALRDKNLKEEEDAAAEEIRIAKAAADARIAQRDRLTQARKTLNPAEGLAEEFRNSIIDLNNERDGSIEGDKAYYLLANALYKKFLEDQKAQFSDYNNLLASVQSERQRLLSQYLEAEAIIKIAVKADPKKLKESQELLAALYKQLGIDFKAISDKEISDAQAALDAKQRILDEEFNSALAHRTRMANARATIDPLQGEYDAYKIAVDKLVREKEKTRKEGGITLKEYHVLLEALTIAHHKRLADINANAPELIEHEKYKAAKDAAIKTFESLSDSFLSERDKIRKEAQKDLGIVDDVETFNGAPEIERARIRKAIRDKEQADLVELAEKDKRRREREQAEKDREQQDAIDKAIALRDRLTQAKAVTSPLAGLAEAYRNDITDLRTELSNFAFTEDQFYVLANARLKQFIDEQQRIRDQDKKNKKRHYSELTRIQKEEVLSGIASNFLTAATKNVGAYITLNDSMTKSERESAIKQNALNKKKFQQNKKYQLGQVAINTAAGISRAYAENHWTLATGISAGILAVGLRQAQNIRAASFGGANATGGSSGGTSINPNQFAIDAAQDRDRQQEQTVNVFVLTLDEIVDREKYMKLSLEAARTAQESDRITYETESGEPVYLAVNE